MREYMGVAALANLVSMLRAVVDGVIWLADDDEEGRFYERCAHEKARIVAAPLVAVTLLRSVQGRGVEGLVATVRGSPHTDTLGSDVFQPDLGDVASLLLTSRTCPLVIEGIVGKPWLIACESAVGPFLHRAVLVARLLGRVRQACINSQDEPPPMSQMAEECIDWTRCDADWDRIGQSLTARGLATADLEQIRSTPEDGAFDSLLGQFDGMDAVDVIVAAIKFYRPRGIQPHMEVSRATLIVMLRMTFDLEELENQEMLWHMKQWQQRNPGYPFLRQWRDLDPLGVVLDQRYWEKDLGVMVRFMGMGDLGGLAVFKMDLDDFSNVNNTLGHASGDDALRLYCGIVKTTLSSIGQVYRRGGDEVVVLALGINPTEAQEIAERLRLRIAQEFSSWAASKGLPSAPTASIGVALLAGGCSVEEVIRLMDEAQRRAKEGGKNRVVCLEQHPQGRGA